MASGRIVNNEKRESIYPIRVFHSMTICLILMTFASNIVALELLENKYVFETIGGFYPLFEHTVYLVFFLFEHLAACRVRFGDVAVELVYFQIIENIFLHQSQTCFGISFSLIGIVHKKAECNAAVVDIEIEQINRTYRFTCFYAYHHQPELKRFINILVRIQNVLF